MMSMSDLAIVADANETLDELLHLIQSAADHQPSDAGHG
jgi:hypothetical protein